MMDEDHRLRVWALTMLLLRENRARRQAPTTEEDEADRERAEALELFDAPFFVPGRLH
jgi:hypothetical protein